MSYEFLGKKVSGPFTIPSGIVTVTYDTCLHLATTIPELGIITTKSIGPEVRDGNREPVYCQVDAGSRDTFQNAVGLAGPGCDLFAKELESSPRLPKDKFLLISIFGRNAEDFVKVATTLERFADGFELNFSCPHAEGHGLELCASVELAAGVVRALKTAVPNIPLIPKLSPNLSDDALENIAKAMLSEGAAAFSTINTLGPKDSDVLSNKRGGLSGPVVFTRALEVIRHLRAVLDKNNGAAVPIIGMGGVATPHDVERMMAAGAKFIGVGSSLTGLNTAQCRDVFRCLMPHATTDATGTIRALQASAADMVFYDFKVATIEKVNPKLAILTLDKSIACRPGQFVMVWVPGVGEKPFAPATQHPCTLVVRDVGLLTSHLVQNTNVGDTIKIRGVYGTSYTVPPHRVHTLASELHNNTKFVLVGGGTGIAPLLLLAQNLSAVAAVPREALHVFLGGRSATEIYFREQFGAVATVHVATDDGSEGHHGTVVALLKDKLSGELNDGLTRFYFYNCGPEKMMYYAYQAQKEHRREVVEASIERYMKCGVGICGVCTCDGRRMCVDGPIVGEDFLANSACFGKSHRAKTTQLLDW
eukprot:PhM_4_TR3445/c0_g2_i1/m.21915